MRFPLRVSRRFRWLTPFAAVALGSLLSVGSILAQTTTITGHVYSPLGPIAGDPIPNIFVYVAQTPVLDFNSTVGQGVTGGCSAQQNLVSGNPLVSALTDAYGAFTLTSTSMPNPATIVIQAGKWRRQYPNTAVTIGGTTTLQLTMPANQSQGDLPHIAVVTGSSDSIECIFPQIGISSTEITDPTGTGSINLYQGAGGPGEKVSTSTPTESALVASPSTLANYDVVIFGCQGTANDPQATAANQQNIVNFANAGGRVFGTHYGYVWLDSIQPFESSAVWPAKEVYSQSGSGYLQATINQSSSFPQGALLSQWLVNVGASTTLGTIPLQQVRVDTSGVNTPPSQNWVTLNAASTQSGISATAYPGTPSMQFTFDTPIGQSGVPVVAVTYANSSTSFVQGDASDSISITATNTSTTDADSTLVLNVVMPSTLTATSLTDTTGNWSCVITPGLRCTRTTPLTAGTSDSVLLTFSIPASATVGQSTITASLTGGGLSGTQCGRVLYNDYHVESTGGNVIFPKDCLGGFSAQQKFLEYSLYNLSNFVSPSSSDVIVIQGTTATTFAALASSSIFYGQTISVPASVIGTGASNAVDGGSLDFTINGTQYCQIAAAAGGSCPTPIGPLDVLPSPGTYTLQWSYTGDTNYVASTSTAQSLTVNPDPTTTTLTSSINPAVGGQNVTYTATVADAYTTAVGSVTFYDGATVIGNVPLNSSGVATLTLSDIPVGNRLLTATYNPVLNAEGAYNFITSTSGVLTEIITIPTAPTPTTTLVVSNINPSVVGQTVTFAASVGTTGAFPSIPAGIVTFLDGTTSLGTATLDANGNATFSISTLVAGTHPITVSYGGSTIAATSVSAVLSQVVQTSLSSAGTGFLLNTDTNALTVNVGGSAVANLTVIELNGFNQPVTLTCSGLPTEATCAFDQSVIPAVGGTTRLVVSAAAPHNCSDSTPYFTAQGGSTALPLLAFALVGFLARRRRVLKGLVLAAALCILPALSGCSSACTDLATRPGTYTVTVTGTAAGSTPVSKSQTLTVTVVIPQSGS